MTTLLQELDEVLAFLDGTGELEGVSFGEIPDGERGKYWWRSRLNKLAPEIRAALELQAKLNDGWVLVPREPTDVILTAICIEHGAGEWPDGYDDHARLRRLVNAYDGYKSMCKAVLSAGKEEQDAP